MSSVTRLGLTGGIGSGKSTVAQVFSKLGAAVIDADQIARRSTSSGGLAISSIAQTFGVEFITPEGALDRDCMRKLAFSNQNARFQLEQIIHPLVRLEARRQAEIALQSGFPLVIFDIPLLVESSHWRSELHQILVIDCLEETQIDRVLLRDALTRDEIRNILLTQSERICRLQAADVVLYNDGLSLKQLEIQVHEVAHRFGL